MVSSISFFYCLRIKWSISIFVIVLWIVINCKFLKYIRLFYKILNPVNKDVQREKWIIQLTICLNFLEYSKIRMVGIFASRHPALRYTYEFTITHTSRSSFEIGYSTYQHFIRTCRAVDLGLYQFVNLKLCRIVFVLYFVPPLPFQFSYFLIHSLSCFLIYIFCLV